MNRQLIIAIVPTACGIETPKLFFKLRSSSLQQYLPLAVLKPPPLYVQQLKICAIAIVPTACGIETPQDSKEKRKADTIAIVPTACGIET